MSTLDEMDIPGERFALPLCLAQSFHQSAAGFDSLSSFFHFSRACILAEGMMEQELGQIFCCCGSVILLSLCSSPFVFFLSPLLLFLLLLCFFSFVSRSFSVFSFSFFSRDFASSSSFFLSFLVLLGFLFLFSIFLHWPFCSARARW